MFTKLNPLAQEFFPSSHSHNHLRHLSSNNFFPNNFLVKPSDNDNYSNNRRRRNNFNQGRRLNGRVHKTQREDSVRRTVYVSDIDQHVTEERLAALFSCCGQVIDCRICGDPHSILRFAFVEFADERGARAALNLGGTVLGYYPVRVLPSKTAILPVNPTFLPRAYVIGNSAFHYIMYPSCQGNCTQLVMLDVARSELSGPIPPWIGYNLHNLQVLSMRNNHFYGSLPLYLCHLTNIQVLDLSLNNLSAQIPRCLQNLSAMSRKPKSTDAIDEFYVFINGSPSYVFSYDFYPTVRWKGKELSFKDNQRLLKLIDISENELCGEIPREIGNLSELVSLDLSSNNLSGEIPRELGNLHALEFLDLSTNHISGTIPSSLSEMNWLAVLNLSNNNLSGKIPSGTQLQSFDASAYDGNPFLCGSPLKRLCPDEKGSKAASIEEEQDSFLSQGFYISMGLGFVTGFWAIFGSLLIFRSWRHSYFTFLHNLYERIVVLALINLARRRRLLRT